MKKEMSKKEKIIFNSLCGAMDKEATRLDEITVSTSKEVWESLLYNEDITIEAIKRICPIVLEKFPDLIEKYQKKETIDFTRVNNDINGNPRYVCHFTVLLTEEQQNIDYYNCSSVFNKIEAQYQQALNNSRRFGGKKFHNKQYGGGIAFQSYNIDSLTSKILEFTNK